MAQKKNKKKNAKSASGGGEASSAVPTETAGAMETPAEKQLWAALRQEDHEALCELLFDAVQDAQTGGRRLVAKPSSKALVNRLNPKRLLPLCYAVEERLPDDFIVSLLDAGADVNRTEGAKGGNAPLHHACFAEDEALLDLLLSRGANPKIANGSGETALHILAVSRNPRLLRTVLDSVVGHTSSTAADHDAAESTECSSSGGRDQRVRMSPTALLAVASHLDGTTALHVALENSPEATEVLLSCLETTAPDRGHGEGQISASPSSSGSLAAVLTQATIPNADTPLHLVSALTHVTADVPAVVRVWERLLRLGARPTALNAEAQSPLAVLIEKGDLTAARMDDMHRVLNAVAATNAQTPATLMDELLTQTDQRGLAVSHVAITRHQTAFLAAVRALLFAHASTVNVSETAQRWLGQTTRDGVRVVELLASQDVPAEMVAVFEQLDLVDKAEFAALREAHQQAQRARAEAEAEEAAQASAATAARDSAEAREDDAQTSGPRARDAGEKSHATGAVGASRVQQARKARAAATAAASATSRHHPKRAGATTDGAGAHQAHRGSGWALSTPAKVLCGLMVLAVFVLVYTSLVPPTVRGGDDL